MLYNRRCKSCNKQTKHEKEGNIWIFCCIECGEITTNLRFNTIMNANDTWAKGSTETTNW